MERCSTWEALLSEMRITYKEDEVCTMTNCLQVQKKNHIHVTEEELKVIKHRPRFSATSLESQIIGVFCAY